MWPGYSVCDHVPMTPIESPTAPLAPLNVTIAARVEHASKIYGRDDSAVYALNDVTVEFHKGEFTAIMGPSGSGKSTLALAAMGYLKTGLRVFEGSAQFCETDMF